MGPRSLWAMVQGDPVFMRRVNGWLTVFWIAMIPVSVVFGWIYSVAYISALSLWALVSGHWAAWQAARVEVAQEQEHELRQQESGVDVTANPRPAGTGRSADPQGTAATSTRLVTRSGVLTRTRQIAS